MEPTERSESSDHGPEDLGQSKAFALGWRELRIAPVMTGGTSLAVWIGGVTAELYRVCNRSADDPGSDVYGKLLEFTETDALVDVITGTSAGGLNGVMLSVAWALRVRSADVVALREVWMKLGSIDALLRKPSERHPASLLRGDEYFWPQLTEVLEELGRKGRARAADWPDDVREVNLLVTVTTLTGEPTRRFDDIGQPLDETRQAHSLQFRTRHFGDPNDPEWAKRLALAARTSASIPAVFEASYLPYKEKVPERPRFEEQATFRAGRWAMDGGVLDNKPIGIAMKAIFNRPAAGQVRRVMLYVNPTPGGPATASDDEIDDVPSILSVLTAANNAPRNEGIADDLDRLKAFNREAERSVDVRSAISRLVGSELQLDLSLSADAEYQQFRRMRATASVGSMLERNAPEELVDSSLEYRNVKAALSLAAETDAWLPPNFERGFELIWPWGIAPLDYAAAVLYDVISRALRLRVTETQRRDLGTLRSWVHGAVRGLNAARVSDDKYWKICLDARPRSGSLGAWAQHCYQGWPQPTRFATLEGGEPVRPPRTYADRTRLGRVAGELAEIMVGLAPTLSEVLAAVAERGESALFADDVQRINEYLTLLAPPTPNADSTADGEAVMSASVEELKRRLVALHILAVVFGDTARRPQPIELIEVSWKSPNALDDRLPADKVAGTEFSRLGAFIKPSWRANDWMWGRLDGAYQLVLLLLDPARLLQLGVSPVDVANKFGLDQPSQRDELAFLDDRSLPVPLSLPECAEAIARSVQITIAREELPFVYDAVMRSNEEGAREGDAGTFRRAFEKATRDPGPLSDVAVPELLRQCRIGDEKGGEEFGQDMLTRSAGRAAAVAGNAITGDHAGVGWPSRFGAPVRQLGLAIYALTQAMTTSSKTGIGLSAVVFGSAAAVIAMQLLGTSLNVGVVFLASVVLIVGALIAIARSGVWAQLPAVGALAIVALALMGPQFREVVTSVPGPRTESIATRGDRLVVHGSVVLGRRGGRGVAVGEDLRARVSRGHVDVVHVAPDSSWKDTYFLNPFSVAAIAIWIAAFAWVFSLIDRVRLAWRRYSRERMRAVDAGHDPPSLPLRPVIEIVATIVTVPAILLLQHWFFDWLLTGDDTGWRHFLINVAEELGKRDVVVVIAGLVLVGVFLGLAWDRGLRRILALVTQPLRRRIRERRA